MGQTDHDDLNAYEVDPKYVPENLSDQDLMKAYVALQRSSVVTRSAWLDRIEAELKRRGIALPH